MTKTFAAIAVVSLLCAACQVPENKFVKAPVDVIVILKNQEPLDPGGVFEIHEGKSAILTARLFPEGVTGGVHWQSSGGGIVEMSGFSGSQITITGANGGRTVISVLARNSFNETYVQAECTVIVIPFSFFKWNFARDGWLDMGPRENVFVGKIRDTIIRSGEKPVPADAERGGLVLEGPGALIIGSGMTSLTSSAFPDDPVYDQNGEFDFFDGPAYEYLAGSPQLNKTPWPLWKNRVRISVDYEILGGSPRLRLQVNNNTLQRDSASAIDNWLAAELGSPAPPSGTLSGVFRGNGVARLDPLLTTEKKAGINAADDEGKIKTVLSHSFVCLALPEGRILIRGIRIESAD